MVPNVGRRLQSLGVDRWGPIDFPSLVASVGLWPTDHVLEKIKYRPRRGFELILSR